MSKLNIKDLKQLLSRGADIDGCMFCCGSNDNDIIVRGSDCQQSFNLPFDAKYIDKIVISYVQDDVVLVRKCLDDIEVAKFDDTLIYYTLSESETLRFKPSKKVYVQFKAELTNAKHIVTSDIYEVNVIDILDDGILSEDMYDYYAIVNVNNQTVRLSQIYDISCKSNKLYKCKFLYDSSWSNKNVVFIFKDEYDHEIEVVQNDINDECIIPNEVIQYPGLVHIRVESIEEDFKKISEWSNSIIIR